MEALTRLTVGILALLQASCGGDVSFINGDNHGSGGDVSGQYDHEVGSIPAYSHEGEIKDSLSSDDDDEFDDAETVHVVLEPIEELCAETSLSPDENGFIDYDDLFATSDSPVVARTALTATAGGLVGNGGDAIVCRDDADEIIEIRLLDYFEAEELFQTTIVLGGAGLSVEAKVDLALSRIQTLDPERFALWSKYAGSFFAEAGWVEDPNRLEDVPDSHHIAIPQGCKIEQLAIQRPPEYPGDARYWIQKNLYDALSDDHKAGLVLHEIIYREAVSLGHETSTRVRSFTALVSSETLPTLTPEQYQDVVIGLEFDPVIHEGGIPFYLGSLRYYEDTTALESGRLFSDYLHINSVTFAKGTRLNFYQSGAVKEGELGTYYFDHQSCIKVGPGHRVSFTESGELALIDGKFLEVPDSAYPYRVYRTEIVQ